MAAEYSVSAGGALGWKLTAETVRLSSLGG